MIIAATYENGNIFQHFGRTEQFKLYRVENGAVAESQIVSAEGYSHGSLAVFLKKSNAEVLLCGGIGGGAQQALAQQGIQCVGGCSGNTDEAVKNYLSGTLQNEEDFTCHHHDHEQHGENKDDCGQGGCC